MHIMSRMRFNDDAQSSAATATFIKELQSHSWLLAPVQNTFPRTLFFIL